MARSRFNFSRFLTDTVSLYHLGAFIQANGGMGIQDYVSRLNILTLFNPNPFTLDIPNPYATLPCAFQPISGDKVLEFQQINIIATHVALFNQGISDMEVGDFFINNDQVFDVTYFEAEGGILNPIGVVFAVYGRLRLNR